VVDRYYCPRCGNKNIIEYEETFDCPICELEFDKKDFKLIEDKSSILSLQEKSGIAKVLKEDD
jgi:rubredoxin